MSRPGSTAQKLRLAATCPVLGQNAGLFVSRGQDIHPDRVIDSHELILVRGGTLGIREEERSFEVGRGQTLLLWPGLRHRGSAPYLSDLSFYWIHFTLAPARAGAHTDEADEIVVPQLGCPRRPEVITELLHRFMADQESGHLRPVAAGYLLMLMLVEAADQRPAQARGELTGEVIAARAEAHIAAHFHQTLGTAGVADQLGFNSDYLERVFRRARGVSVTEYIHRTRIREARALLRESDLNVAQVAAACGFADSVYFRRLFKRHTGTTPLEFRRLYTRCHINVR